MIQDYNHIVNTLYGLFHRFVFLGILWSGIVFNFAKIGYRVAQKIVKSSSYPQEYF